MTKRSTAAAGSDKMGWKIVQALLALKKIGKQPAA